MTIESWIPGLIIRIKLQDGLYAYGRLLKFPFAGFYDFCTDESRCALEEIVTKPVLFIVAVHKSVLANWEIIGKIPLEDHLLRPIRQFSQSLVDFRKCEISDDEGNVRTVTPEECIGLERAAVWEARHVEERLLDHCFDRPNPWAESLKVKLR